MLDAHKVYHEDYTSIFDDDGQNILEAILKHLDQDEEDPLDYIFVFDDLSTELKNMNIIGKLMKENRHYHAMVIVSSQYWNDLSVYVHGQIDYALLFGKIAEDKLEDAYRNMGLSVNFGDFLRLYDVATKESSTFYTLMSLRTCFAWISTCV